MDSMDQRIERMEALLHNKLRALVSGMNCGQIKMMLRDDEHETLLSFMEIGLSNELYELCAAIRDILAERRLSSAPAIPLTGIIDKL